MAAKPVSNNIIRGVATVTHALSRDGHLSEVCADCVGLGVDLPGFALGDVPRS
jgi:hypothetical protein